MLRFQDDSTHSIISEFNYSFKWVDDDNYGRRNLETGEWNGMMGELLSQVSKFSSVWNNIMLK